MTMPHISDATTRRIKPYPSTHAFASAPDASESCAQSGDARTQARHTSAVLAPAPAYVAVHTDAPKLPDPVGEPAPAASVRRCVESEFFLSGSSVFAALQTMTEGKQSDMILAQLIKRVRFQAQMLSKQRDLEQKRREIVASNTSASGRLVASGMATGLSGVAAWFFRFQDVGINQAITGAFDYWDRTFGGQSRANEAMLEQKHETIVGQLEQQHVDAANAWYEQVKEARKNAQQSLMTHVQMVGDAVNSVWR